MIELIYEQYIKSGLPVSTDSRNIIPNSVFFALKGDNFNGNKYAADALKKGASLAVIDDNQYLTEKTILVEDTLSTLQELAKLYRKRSEFKVIALTGTNGKTTTKELIRIVLSKKYNCNATVGNLNNHIGVPVTVLSTPQHFDFLVVEMGANHQGEIASLCNIAQPDFGLITNIGKAHLDGFGGFEGVVKAKNELYNYLKKHNKLIFVNGADTTLTNLVSAYDNTAIYNISDSCCSVEKIDFNGNLSAFINLKSQPYLVQTEMFGKYNITNFLAAACVGIHFEVDENKIVEALRNYKPENNRSQVLKTSHNTLILDSYNANPTSMKTALESFGEISAENKVTILGEMKELGEYSFEEHKAVIAEARNTNSKLNLFVGEAFLPFSGPQTHVLKDTDELIGFIKKENIQNSLVFIKGSRANRLEKIVGFL